MNLLMLLVDFAVKYWGDILVVVGMMVTVIVLIKMRKKELVQKIVYALVVQAEQQLGSKTGSMKKAYVMSHIYPRLPFLIRLIFSQEDLEHFIELAVRSLKESLKYNKELNLLTYAEEKKG